MKKGGDFIVYKEKKNDIIDVEKIVQSDFNTKLQDGKLLLSVKTISAEEVFKKCNMDNPGAKLALYSLLPDGSALTVLTINDKIICNIGINVYLDKNGEKCFRYIPINQHI